jgi:hypothetical protein
VCHQLKQQCKVHVFIYTKQLTIRTSIIARLGWHGSFESVNKIMSAATWIAHANFDLNTLVYDVTLIRLSSNVTYSDAIRPICLPMETDDFLNQNSSPLVTAGWGLTESKYFNDKTFK